MSLPPRLGRALRVVALSLGGLFLGACGLFVGLLALAYGLYALSAPHAGILALAVLLLVPTFGLLFLCVRVLRAARQLAAPVEAAA